MNGGIPMVWMVFAFFAFLVWALTTQPDTLTALLDTPVWFMIPGVAYAVVRRSPTHQARVAERNAVSDAETGTPQQAVNAPAGPAAFRSTLPQVRRLNDRPSLR